MQCVLNMAALQCCCLSQSIALLQKPRPLRSSGMWVPPVAQKDDAAMRSVSPRFVNSCPRGQKLSHLCLAGVDPAGESGIQPDSSFPVKEEKPNSIRQNWWTNAADLRRKVSKWGLAAVLAYGLFDGITYTTCFVLAFLSYEKSTGQNPAANLKALLGVVVLMWGGNNVTRPFRVAGAAALAPFLDKDLKKLQNVLKLPSQTVAFIICVATFAAACFSVVALLILSRLGR